MEKRKTTMRRCLRLLCLWLMFAGLTASAQPAPSVVVDINGSGVTVAPTIHGLFFEDINYGADGGLYAELVQNRSFEHRETLYSWSENKPGGAQGQISIQSETPLNEHNRNFLRLEVAQSGES